MNSTYFKDFLYCCNDNLPIICYDVLQGMMNNFPFYLKLASKELEGTNKYREKMKAIEEEFKNRKLINHACFTATQKTPTFKNFTTIYKQNEPWDVEVYEDNRTLSIVATRQRSLDTSGKKLVERFYNGEQYNEMFNPSYKSAIRKVKLQQLDH